MPLSKFVTILDTHTHTAGGSNRYAMYGGKGSK